MIIGSVDKTAETQVVEYIDPFTGEPVKKHNK